MSIEHLKPLVAPNPVSLWPPAPGWWLLALLLVVSISVCFFWYRRRHQKPQTLVNPLDPIRAEALNELNSLTKPYFGAPAAPWLQQLNSLLKRLCRLSYPEASSHTLTGRAWLAFLDNRCPAAGLTRWMILVEGAYKGHCQMTDKAIDELEQAIEVWIRKHV